MGDSWEPIMGLGRGAYHLYRRGDDEWGYSFCVAQEGAVLADYLEENTRVNNRFQSRVVDNWHSVLELLARSSGGGRPWRVRPEHLRFVWEGVVSTGLSASALFPWAHCCFKRANWRHILTVSLQDEAAPSARPPWAKGPMVTLAADTSSSECCYFALHDNEVSLPDYIIEPGFRRPAEWSEVVGNWPSALQLLDRHDWVTATPERVDPRFAQQVLEAVEQRHDGDLSAWKRRCGTYRCRSKSE